jgi:hypothetical protein
MMHAILCKNGLTFKMVPGKRKFRPFETKATTVRDCWVFSNMAFHFKWLLKNREIIMIDECVSSQTS